MKFKLLPASVLLSCVLNTDGAVVVVVQQSGKAGTVVGGQTVQRIILPAAPSSHTVQTASSASIATPTTLATLRPTLQTATPGLTQLPPGTTLLTPSTTLQGLQGFALVPAQYVTQVSRRHGACCALGSPP